MSNKDLSAEQPLSLPDRGRKRSLKLILGSIAILLFGMIIGSGLTFGFIGRTFREIAQHPEKIPEHLIRHLDRKLDLTDEQAEKITVSVNSTFEFFMKKRAENFPENRARIEEMNSEIETVLTPEQKEEFSKMKSRFMDHWVPPVQASPDVQPEPAQ